MNPTIIKANFRRKEIKIPDSGDKGLVELTEEVGERSIEALKLYQNMKDDLTILRQEFGKDLEAELRRNNGYNFRVSGLIQDDLSGLKKKHTERMYGYLTIDWGYNLRDGRPKKKDIGVIFPLLKKAFLFRDAFERGGLRREEGILERRGYEVKLSHKSSPYELIRDELI